MTDPVRDDEELFRVFDYARNHPENWDQRHFRKETYCGTSYCLAGFKVFVIDGVTEQQWNEMEETFSQYAGRTLGLNETEAWELFFGAISNKQVEDTVKAIMNDEYRNTNG